MAAVSPEGQHRLCLDEPLELLAQSLDAVRGARALPLGGRQRVKVKSCSPTIASAGYWWPMRLPRSPSAQPRIARASERRDEFLLQELFDETADPPAYTGLEPVVPASPTSKLAVSVVIRVISFGGR